VLDPALPELLRGASAGGRRRQRLGAGVIEMPVVAGQTVVSCSAGVAVAEGVVGGLGDHADPELAAESFRFWSWFASCPSR